MAGVEKVAIIGAGIAGLTAALSLASHGIASDIFEEAPRLEEVGAGLQIAPNASHLLRALGLLPALEAVWNEPECIALVNGLTLRDIAYVPAGHLARERWGAPYGVLHRATLQRVLLEAVTANPLCRLYLSTPIRDEAALAALPGQPYPLVIGADGVWSRLRSSIPGSGRADFSGNIAWRFTLAESNVPSWLAGNRVRAFLGPSAHLVTYPLRDADPLNEKGPLREAGCVNAVAIASGLSPGRTWAVEANAEHKQWLLSRFRRWDRRILVLLNNAAAEATVWPLHQVTPGRWQNGRDRVLIGDAAHAMMPFAAQGAGMAIEDAFMLAAEIAGSASLAGALSRFERQRSARIARVRAQGTLNGFVYHARGPIRLGRDLVLRLHSPGMLASSLDWLYRRPPDRREIDTIT